jgi:outer membrane protein OmpA-like peptidoglycan-associated protein
MKRAIHLAVPLFVGLFVGCAGSSESMGPSKSLVRARQLQQEASQSRARQLAAADVKDAERMLAGAEAEHKRMASSNMEKHLAAMAVEKFERAMAQARLQEADEGYLNARLEGERGQQTATAEVKTETRVEDVASVRETEEGRVITLPGEVLFRSGESELLPNARDRLRVVANALKEQTEEDFGIVVEGHADARGTDEFNARLSEARAQSVKQFLVSEGVDAERVRTVGRGEREPIATNDTPEGRANNRRVEIIVPGEA